MRPLLMLTLAALSLTSCAPGQESALPDEIARWAIDPGSRVAIGGEDERPEYLIERVAGTTRLSDGRIVVADGGASHVRVYDVKGEYVLTHGGAGDGPGEFQSIMEPRRGPGDTLIVMSFRPGLTWVHPDEGYLGTESFSLWEFGVPCRFAEGNWHVLPTGKLFFVFEQNTAPQGCGPTPEGVHRLDGLLVSPDYDSPSMDTFAILPSTERQGNNYRVLAHMLMVGIGADRVFAGDTNADSILVFALDGSAIGSLPTPFEAQPVPSSATTEAVPRRIGRDGQEIVGDPYQYPDMLPRFGKLVPGPEGSLWVMAYPTNLDRPIVSYQVQTLYSPYLEPGGSAWRVLTAEGRIRAEIDLPERFVLVEVGPDYVLGIERDAFDVESVVVYGLQTGMGGS